MKPFAHSGKIILLLALGLQAVAFGGTNSAAPPVPASPREFYNAGTKMLAATNFAEAEKYFEAALAAQDERVQPAALYNLGHTRFDEGSELLKKGPDAQKTAAQGNAVLAAGDRAIRQGESALAENDLNKMIAAYLEGRHMRSELRETEKAVREAMETYEKVLAKWQRAVDDFKGTTELNSIDKNSPDNEATLNAKIVERRIAKLVDELRQMQQMMGAMGKQRQDLGKMLSQLKGRIPAPNAPPGAAGEDDEEEDQGVKPDSLAGQKENASREGGQIEMPLSPDVAGQLLGGLGLDGSRRLPMNETNTSQPKERSRRTW